MKRLLTLALSILIAVSLLAVCASAEAFNAAGGCKTETTVFKANAADVVKDGEITDGEYVELDIDRNAESSDCMLSYETAEVYDSACELLKNVHFYLSWDEAHGLNVAVRATLLETPTNTSPQPDDTYFDGFPGDEFLFQFGMMFRVSGADGKTVMSRGISLNTESGTPLYGHYNENGYTGSLSHTWGEDYFIKIVGNTVTYEISFPIESVLPAASLNDSTPTDGARMNFDVSATGGSLGVLHKDSNMYAVSVGDAGYMAQWNLFESPSHAKAVFSSEQIKKSADSAETTPAATTAAPDGVPTDVPDSTSAAPTQPITTRIESSVVTSTAYVTDSHGDVVTDEHGENVTELVSEVVTSVVTDEVQKPVAPSTGDPAVISVVVGVIAACGAVVAKRKK